MKVDVRLSNGIHKGKTVAFETTLTPYKEAAENV